MRLILTRDVFADRFTLGCLAIEYDGELRYTDEGWVPNIRNPDPLHFGFVVEDRDRGLASHMAPAEIRKLKVAKETAIPIGRFRVRRTWSPKFERDMMLLANVPGYEGIRIHPGDDAADTWGCWLPGLDRDVAKGTVSGSSKACAWLDGRVAECEARGEEVWAYIKRAPREWSARLGV